MNVIAYRSILDHAGWERWQERAVVRSQGCEAVIGDVLLN